MKLVLEARHLFDGSLHAVAKHATDAADHDRSHHDQAHPAEHHSPPASVTPASISYADVPALAPNPTAHEILFVAARVANWQSLASSVKSDVQVVLIDPGKDGIDQVTAALQGRRDLTSIQFLTYGQPGQLELGSSAVTAASLSSHAAEVASWGDHLAPGADIEFWGCDVGQGSAGQAFVDTVHTLTGANVGASDDLTGAAALGGNWVLEDTTGPLHGAVFSTKAMADYQGVLDDANPIVTLSQGVGSLTGGTSGNVLLGDTFTETVTFSNGSAGVTGYGPIVNLFVPTNKATDTETATLSSASYLSSAIDITHKITLTSTAAGHVGTVGAFNPFVLDTSGNPTFIAAPNGFVAGDSMYVLVLPFGSFTPGEPAANVTLHFTADSSSELTSHSGNSINIAASGAFEFGHDALNDPASDPSIQGAAVSSATMVSLVNVTATTDLHEGETATGPDNPFDYVITVATAPAVSGDPITGLTVTFELPDQVEHTGGSGTITVSTAGTPTFTPHTGGILQGGSVSVTLPSLSGTATITVPVFVPETDAGGATILTAANHYQNTITDTPAFHYTGTWTPTTGLAAGTPEGVSDSGSSAVTFVAKGLAIQVTDNSGNQIAPGQTDVVETIHFQVSDYLNLNNLVITDVLGDGFTLDPTKAPTLMVDYANSANASVTGSFGATAETPTIVNGQSVYVSGSTTDAGSHTLWSYSRNDVAGDGTTTISFMVGALLADSVTGTIASLGSVLQGGSGMGSSSKTQGTISFDVNVLDKYTETNPADTSNPVSAGNPGQSLREQDGVGNTVTTTGTMADVVDITNPANIIVDGNTTDNSGLTDTVPSNTLALAIVDVNGTASDGSSGIKAGDTVTYELTYTLTSSADYGNLSLSSFLPLPVFSTSDPLALGSIEAFMAGSGFAAGTYHLVMGPSGAIIISAGANGTANSLTFSLGTHDDPTNTGGEKIVIDFSIKASDAPFADGLFLTNLANSKNFNAENVNTAITADAIQKVVLDQPELVTKTGVVSVVGDNGTTTKGSYSVDPNDATDGFAWPSQSTNPGSAFQPAGSSGDPLLSNPLGSSDLNVTGVDGSDTARVVTTIENTGNAAAYNVEVKGAALPPGATVADITVYDASGNAISTADIMDTSGGALANGAARVAAYFSGGIQIADPSGLAHNGVYYIVYDLVLPATQATGTTISTAGTIVNWWNNSASTSAATGFVSGNTAVGVPAAALTDNATIGISAPSIAKTVIAGNDAASGEPVALPTVVLGETITYQLVITLPEGDTTNGGSDVTITDVLPTGTTFVGTPTISYDGHIILTGGPSSGGSITVDQNGQTLTFHLGTAIANSLADGTDTITITYQAKLTATDTPANGATFTNNASFHYDGTAIAGTSATVTELNPNVTETIGVKDHATGSAVTNIYSGEVLDYTVSLTNASGAAPANNLTFYVEVPTTADLTALTSLVAQNGGTITDNGAGGNGEVLKITLPGLAAGATANFTFEATVKNNLAAGTNIVVDTPTGTTLSGGPAANGSYNSLPTAIDTGHSYSASGSNTETVAQLTPSLGIIGEANNTSGGGTGLYGSAVTSVNATVGDIIRYSAAVQLPEGQQSDLQLTVNLPNGMEFQNDGSITIELISPDGSITTVDFGSAASAAGGNPTTAKATFSLPASQILVNPDGSVTFDIGQVNDNEGSALPDFAIVQFNAIVANQASNVDHTALTANAAIGNESGEGTPSANAIVTVEEPHVTLTKGVTSIVTSGGVTTITYTETVTNTGDATAYNVALDDPEGSNVGAIGNATVSGNGTLTISSGNGTTDFQAGGTLLAGKSNTFTYTEVVTNATQGVSDTTATVTYTSLSNATTGGETLAGSATGASGSATGSRDGTTTPASLNNYNAQVTLGLGVVEGNVWNDVGSPLNTAHQGLDSGADSELAGVTVSGAWTGGTSSVVTDGSGNFFILLPDMPGLNQKVSTPTSIGNETLVYDTTNSVTFHHTETGLSAANSTLNVTPNASTPVTGYNFAYRQPDTAPVLSTWGNASPTGTPIVTDIIGGAAVTLGTGAAGVSDGEIDTLVGLGLGNYNNTVLTIVRNGGSNADDNFGGSAGASASIGGGLFLSGGIVDLNGVQIGTYSNPTAGTLQITFNPPSGTVTKADIAAVLNNLTYSNTGPATQLTSGILIDASLTDNNTETGTTAGNAFQGTGGVKTSNIVQVLVDLAPTAVGATFTEPNNVDPSTGTIPVVLAPSLTVPAGNSFSQVVLTISGNYQANEDVLTFVNTSDISGVWDSTHGTLTLTGTSASLSDWQAALRSVKYYDSSDTPSGHARTVSIAATSTAGDTISEGTFATITVTPANDSPVLTVVPSDSFATGTENSGTAPVDGSTVGTLVSSLIGGHVTDADGADAHDGSTPGLLGIAITQADTTAGTWWYSTNGGTTWTEFAGAGTTETALSSNGTNALHLLADADTMIYFAPAAGANGTVDTALTYRAWDQFDSIADHTVVNGAVTNLPTDSAFGTGTNTQASAYSANQQVLSLAVTANQTVTYTDPNDTPASGVAVKVDAGLVLTTSDTITSATVTLSGGNAEDVLSFTNTDATTMGDIVGSFSGGVLTLTSHNGATAAEFSAALDAVKFYDTSDTPVTGDRTATIAVVDGTTLATRTLATVTVNVVATNDSPVLTVVPSDSFATGTENSGTAPVDGSTVGTLVSSLIGGHVTDADGADAHDGSTPGLLGIAITQADTTAGTWWYSTNGGTTWTEFAGAGTTETALSSNGTNALHLLADADTMIYFAPAAGANGAVDTALTYRAWDQFDSIADHTVVNGAVTNLPTDSAFGTGTNTQASAYSANQQVLSLAVTANQTVTYTDPNDTPASGAAVTVDAGVVLTTSDAITSATVTLSGGNAEDVLAFANTNPTTMGDIVGSFSGGVLTLTSHNGATAAEFSAALDAVKFYDTSDTPVTGNRTATIAVADGTTSSTRTLATVTVTVDAANDSPVLHDNPVTLGNATENQLGAPTAGTVGTTIDSLIGGGNVTDTDGANSTHGQAIGAVGIAITAADTSEGNWWFSTDGGHTWTEFAGTGTTETALNGANALHLLGDGAGQNMIYFQPTVTNANGVIANALTFRAWDQFDSIADTTVVNGAVTNLPTDGLGVDHTLGTGTNTQASAYSSATQTLSLSITAVGGASYVEQNGADTGTAAVVVDSTAVLTATTDTFTSATVSITNFQPEDQLVFTNGNGVTGSYDSATGVLTLTAAGGVSAETMQAALDSVKYYDGSDTPITTTRNVIISAHDSSAGTEVAVATTTIAISASNDSPVLTVVPSDSFATGTENSGTAPVDGSTVGTLVSSLIGGHVTDADGADAHDGSTPGLLGIAITQADTTAGTWWYSTNGGTTWTEFAGAGTTETALSSNGTNALHLLADADTMIYFAPAAGANGTVDTALTYRAWDQFDSIADHTVVNGAVTNLPTDSAFGTGTNTQASAYSANQQVLSLAVTANQTVTYTDPNDTPASGAAVTVDAGVVLTTSDAITSATVTLSGGNAEDVLAFANTDATTMGDIVGSFSGGVLTLTSHNGATAAEFSAALDAVKFYDTSDTPVTGNRTATIAVADGTTSSTRTLATVTVTVDAANDSPVLTPNPSLGIATATENGPGPTGAVGTLVSSLIGGVTDTDGANAHDGSTPGTLGIAITQADTTEGNWYYSTDGGATWIEFAGSGMTAISDTNALHLVADGNTRIFFQSTVASQSSTLDTALTFHGWDQFDGAANGSLSALPTDTALGTGTNSQASAYSSAVQTVPLTITAVGSSTFTDPNDTAASGAAVAINSGLLLTSGDTFSGATVQITGNFQAGEDVLAGTTVGPFTVGTFDAATGTLTFTGTGTAAQLQAALQAVKFYDTSDTPDTAATRTITITAHDATTNTDRTVSATTMNVVATNDSPVLNGTGVSLNHATEDGGVPVGAVGTLVSSLTGSGNVTDTDGADAHDGSTPGTLGIAITHADTTEGNWYYSTDGGAHWTEFAGNGMTAISDANALHLAADANTRIYFAPTANWNGTIPNALTIRGWDQFDGATNGSLSALPTDSAFGTGTNTHASAYSSATQTLQLVADAVNDAPIAAGSATLATTPEDTTNPPGDTVAHLFGGNFNDSTDQQQTAGNPTGSVANTLAGIAITGNAATAGQGVWQYSTDNGATWTTIPTTGLGDASAIVLPSSADLRFVPVANFNGVPGGLTTRLIDSSTQNVATGVTGLDLSTGTTAFTGVDVSGTRDGGITAVSAATVALNTSVTAVNDAPVVSGSATLAATPEDTASPAGATVASLLGQGTVNYSDAADTVTTAVSGGSVGTPAAAIAITGNASTAAEGTWEYSTDNGAHWTSIPTSGLSDTNALVIPGSAELRFVPVANFNGVPGSLTAHVSDGTALPATGAQDISATEGGTGGWSAGTITLGTSVVAVNDAPIASGSATLAPVAQNATSNPGDTVSDLFGSNFNDSTDQQQTASNPTGSVANTLAGIAITGDAATAGQGTWEYSTDHGATWTAVPTNVSDGSAIIVPVTGSIRFVPTSTFTGTPGALTVHLIDSSAGTLTGAATGVDVTNVGGITAFSAAPVLLSTQVIQSGGRAILTPPAVDPIFGDTTTDDSGTGTEKPPTDDLGTPPAPNHGATTDDYLERPIIPQISLIGSVGNKFVLAEQQAVIAIPENLFEDSYPGAQLEFDARNPAGGALPSWLEFDARNLTFTGTPPASAHGAVDVLIVARDQFGNEATASFRILVGRESEGLQHLLEPNAPPPSTDGLTVTSNGNGKPASGNGAAPGHRTHHAGAVSHGRHADAGHASELVHGAGGSVDGLFASLAQPANGTRHGHSAFSAQLREAGPIGRLSQARQLLETIAKTVSSKPAA